MTQHTPGPWKFKKYATDDNLEELKSLGLSPVPLLTNDGQAMVMGPEGPVVHVICKTPFKRGQGHKADCSERDANARLVAAAPELLEAVALLLVEHSLVLKGEPSEAMKKAYAALAKAAP